MSLYFSGTVFRVRESVPPVRRVASILSLCIKAETISPHFAETEAEVACFLRQVEISEEDQKAELMVDGL